MYEIETFDDDGLGNLRIRFLSEQYLTFAQDKTHEAAMSMLRDFFADPAARADYASKNPAALQAAQNLSQLPPNIQKRLEKIVLKRLLRRQ